MSNKGNPEDGELHAVHLKEGLEDFLTAPDEELKKIALTGKEAGKRRRRGRPVGTSPKVTEAQMVLVHRMLLRKATIEQIADQLHVSEVRVKAIIRTLRNRMRLQVSKLDLPLLVAESLSFYDEVRGMALAMTTSPKIKDNNLKLKAMQVALRAESEKNAFLSQCGVYSPRVIERVVERIIEHATPEQTTNKPSAILVEAISKVMERLPVDSKAVEGQAVEGQAVEVNSSPGVTSDNTDQE